MKIPEAILLNLNQFATNGFAWKQPSLNSQKAYRNHIKQFEEHLHTSGKTSCTATEEDIDEYITHMQKIFSPNTAATRVGAIKSYFGWLKREGKITHKPTIQSLKHIRVQRTDVTEGEIQELLKQMPSTKTRHIRDAAMITLMAYKGFSTEEVINMNVNDVNFGTGLIRHRKNWCTMGRALKYVLKYAQAKLGLGLSQENDEPFFLNKHGERISARSLRRHFNAYLEDANLKGSFSTRDLCMSKRRNEQRIPKLVTG